MLGGSLTRYHTPTLHEEGFLRDLVKIAAPSVAHSVGHGLQAYGTGSSPAEAFKSSGEELKRGLKSKLPRIAGAAVKNKVQESYKKKRQRVKDILGV